MSLAHLPTPLRTFTNGQSPVEAAGATVGEVIEDLERQFPGLGERLVEGTKLRRGLAVFVNDQAPLGGLAAKVPEGASVYFAPAIAGGSSAGSGIAKACVEPQRLTTRPAGSIEVVRR